VALAQAYCVFGFVWRGAGPDDFVCVEPTTRQETADENALAASRVSPTHAPECISGFVWRDAYEGDLVCVPPASRDRAWADNAVAHSRIVDPAGEPYGPATPEEGAMIPGPTGGAGWDELGPMFNPGIGGLATCNQHFICPGGLTMAVEFQDEWERNRCVCR
jgi:hypothetical protein